MKTIITITGIRPDFIRMSEIFKKLDQNFNHILIHSGQHYDKLLSDVFFQELEIREPDYNLGIGGPGKEHFHQTAELSVKLIELIREKNLNPDLIMFLGDSNSVVSAVALKKEGYKIGHIEAGMRSYATYMPEEINRKVCDICTDYFFVYNENYKGNLLKENFDAESIFVVGNTLVEPVRNVMGRFVNKPKTNDFILVDIHRYNNIINVDRLRNIIKYANICHERYSLPIKLLGFNRTIKVLNEHNISLGNVEVVPLMSFNDYIKNEYNCRFLISDSGSAPEECAILKTRVICPRNESERWESVYNNSCFMLDADNLSNINESFNWLKEKNEICDKWLGDGNSSTKVIDILKNILDSDNEKWKPIIAYEKSYEVSNYGRVRSLNRLDSMGNYRVGGIVRVKVKNNGYKQISLCKDGVRTTYNVHRLVAQAFVENKYNKPIVHHIDHDKTNNKAENLEWVTNSENIIYAYKAGRIKKVIGANHRLTKLSKNEVLEIRKLRIEEGKSLLEIANLFNVSFQHISGICSNKKRQKL